LTKRAALEKLRYERIERERKERERSERLLNGESKQSTSTSEKVDIGPESRKYNNQFNPHLANQNKLKSSKKYWLE